MKMNRLCKTLCIFVFACIACFCCFCNLVVKDVSAGSTDFVVSLSCKNNSKSGIYYSASSSLSFDITTSYSGKSKKPNIKVYYKTNNRTAVAELGDYSGLSESDTRYVTLSSSSPSKSVSVSTKTTKFSVDGFSNLFEFEIYKVEADIDGVTVTIDQSKSKCLCSTSATYNYTTMTNSSGALIFAEYNERDKVPMNGINHGSQSKTKVYNWSYSYETVYPSKMSRWYSDFVANGLAQLAIGGDYYIDCTHTWDWSDDEVVIRFMTKGDDDSTTFIKFDRDDKKFDYTHYDLGEYTSTYLGSNGYSVSGRGTGPTYYTIPSSIASKGRYVIKQETYDTCRCKIYDIDLGQILLDTTGPYVTKWSVDCNVNSMEDYVSVYVRFNEPVNVINKNIKLVCYLEPSKNDRTETIFDYYPTPNGTYSDTLQFRCKVANMVNENTKTMSPDGIYPDRFITSSGTINVKDFGLGTSTSTNSMKDYSRKKAFNESLIINGEKLGDDNLDLRQPSISVKQYFSQSISKKNSAVLQINRANKDATIYYCWSESATPFTFSKTLNISESELNSKYTYKQLNLSSSSGTTENSMVFSSDGVLNGNMYLHILVQSKLGRNTGDIVVGDNLNQPIKFDNTAPRIDSKTTNPDTFKTKTIEMKVTDGPYIPSSQQQCASGIASVTMYSTSDITSYTRAVKEGKVDENMKVSQVYNSTWETNRMSHTNGSDIYSMVLSATDSYINLAENEYKSYYIAFQFVDKAGNKSDIQNLDFQKYDFDRRDVFKTVVTNVSNTIIKSDADFAYAFDSKSANTITIKKETVDSGTISIKNITLKGNPIDYTQVISNVTSDNEKITLKFKNNIVGLVEIMFGYNVKVSNTFKFYFTTTNLDATKNKTEIDNSGELINYVYQLKDYNFYYKDKNEAVIASPYGDTTYAPTFSSSDAAFNYVLFNEYKDLSIYRVETKAWADTLRNRNSADRMLALTETHDPQVGDYYIRYKKADWKVGDQTKSNWVYYYYEEYTPTINITALSTDLQKALISVSNSIVANGGYKFLTGSDLDSDGSPKLIPSQYHPLDDTAIVTMCGDPLSPTASYTGDYGIYSSYVKVDGVDQRLLSNYKFKFSSDTMIFYKRTNSTEYSQMDFLNNQLRALTKSTGLYEIIELDNNGINHFVVYVDATSPVIQLSTVKRDDAQEGEEEDNPPQEINAEFDGKTFSAKEFNFTGIIETDDYAYIAVYKVEAVTTFLYKVFRRSDIEELKASITDGNYILKIYDRSGNNYQINIKAMSSALKVDIIEYANNNIKIECNRDKRDIQLYQVECNGKVVATLDDYQKSLTFKDNGVYNIHVIDWYGDEYIADYTFERTLPDIEWHYQKGSTSFVYGKDSENIGMTMNVIDNKHYEIVTNGTLTLYYSSKSRYAVEFLCEEGEEPETQTGKDSLGNNYIKIKTADNYSIKLSYLEYPDIYIVYDVFYDDRSPQINVSIDEHEYLHLDEEEISEFVYNMIDHPELIDPSKDNLDYIPENIKFVPSGEILTHYISSNANVSSNFIKVNLKDESFAVKCEVYIDNVLFQTFEDPNGIPEFVLSRSGNYVIRAYDSLLNMSEFVFNNSLASYMSAYIDGVDKTGVETTYGNQSFEFAVSEYGNVEFLLKTNNIEKYYRFIIKEDGVTNYRVIYNSSLESGIELNQDQKIYSSGSDTTFDFGKADGLDFKFKYDKGTYRFILNTDEENDFEICYKFYNESSAPYYGECYLSKAKTNIDVTVDGETINTKNNAVYTKNGFSIPDPSSNSKIVSVTVKYSGNEDCIYSKEEGYKHIDYSLENAYTICIKNIYGIVNEVTAVISKSFIVEKYVTLLDETTFYYGGNYNNTIYSNNMVKLYVYAEKIDIDATKDGRNFVCKTTTDNNRIEIVLTAEGIYTFDIVDQFDNSNHIEVEIKNVALIFIDGIVYGERNNGILRNEGYTNEKLSIDIDKVHTNNIAYVAINDGNTNKVLLDKISEYPVEISDGYLHSIGDNGTGVYTVIIRDKYGNGATYDVHYREESTLKLYRTTRNDGIFTLIDVEKELEDDNFDGFYSNNSFKFDTDSTNYVFRIDGSNTELISVLEFGQGVERGSKDYEIYYLDEYGFEYTFVAHLYRGEVTCEATNKEEFFTNNTIPTTTKEFSVEFTSGAKCTYELNGKNFTYTEGTVLSKDGRYTFTVEDRAGNITSVVYEKDSICEFEFVDQVNGKKLVSGDVANSSRVAFVPVNNDEVIIESVFLDGVKLESHNSNNFTASGHYEVLIKDEYGNACFFEFYIINHAIRGFEYTTPYTFKITKLDFTNDLGKSISVLGYVNQTNDNSHFLFGSNDERTMLTEDGKYEVTMYSTIYGEYSTFTFTIDNIMPNVELVGCSEGESTLNTITLKNVSVGDTIKVFKDGELVKSTKILSSATEIPEISEGGKYVIEITNEAGNVQTLSFTRIHVSNVAGSTLVIVAAVAIVVVLFIGLVYRTKSKSDR